MYSTVNCSGYHCTYTCTCTHSTVDRNSNIQVFHSSPIQMVTWLWQGGALDLAGYQTAQGPDPSLSAQGLLHRLRGHHTKSWVHPYVKTQDRRTSLLKACSHAMSLWTHVLYMYMHMYMFTHVGSVCQRSNIKRVSVPKDGIQN